ncbi:MAG: cation diffusion facilitator family transporter, partial [Rhodothermales bacterium]
VMLWVAVFGLIANLVSAAILFRDARHSINIRSAFLHILSDGISSVGVVVGGLLIVAYGAYWVDPLLTLAISVYLLIHSYQMLRQTVDILMESTPSDVDIPELIGDISNIDGVVGMHHVHVWQLNENQRALEAHVAIEKEDLSRMEAIKRTIKSRLVERYEIGHSTLEFECRHCDTPAGEGCYEPAGVSPQAV